MTIGQDLSSDEKQILILIKKEPKSEITDNKLKNKLNDNKMDVSIIQKLSKLGLILFVSKTGKQKFHRYKLTPNGRAIIQKPTQKTTQKILVQKSRSKQHTIQGKRSSRLSLASLKQEMDSKFQQQQNTFDSILQRFNMIEKRLGIKNRESSIKVVSEEIELQRVLKEVYEKIRSSEPRLTNLIPLSMIKPKLYEKYNLSDEIIDQTLLKLEKHRKIDLQVAYDAGSLKGAEYGIKIPGRGLVFYVRWR